MRTLKELGERRAIEIIWNSLEHMPDMPIAFGDDVSAIRVGEGKLAVLKIDMLVGKTDVPTGMSLRQAARKAIIMNVSDFAAKGVKPIGVLCSVGFPRNITTEDIEEIGLGLNDGTREYGVYVLGGDTNEASDIIVDCSLIGMCEEDMLVRRSSAQPGDIVAVTGRFGKTSCGLRIILEGLHVPERIKDPLVDSVLMPQARLAEGLLLAKQRLLTSSIDSSDGLAWSLYEISEASDVGLNIDSVPIAPEAVDFAGRFGLEPLDLALYGGEEYELVVTINAGLWSKAEEIMDQIGSPLSKIGVVTRDKNVVFSNNCKIRTIERKGWEHFRN